MNLGPGIPEERALPGSAQIFCIIFRLAGSSHLQVILEPKASLRDAFMQCLRTENHMKKLFLALLLNLCMSFSASADVTVTRLVGNDYLTVKTCNHDAGAICSLIWRGVQFIDDYDHGRQLQSAVSFNGLGEALNPTEAGASYLTDGFNPSPSSSLLLSESSNSQNHSLATTNQMAYWNPVNGQKRSNIIFEKQVQVGLPGMAHVIKYDTHFTVPAGEYYSTGQFEVLTGYMPSYFSKFYTYDVRNNAPTVVALSDGPGEQNLPIIFATSDGGWAMGIYSPGTPQPTYPGAGYGRWRHTADNVVKWNNVYRLNGISPGTYSFTSYVFVGSLDNVIVSMQQLYATLGAQGLPR